MHATYVNLHGDIHYFGTDWILYEGTFPDPTSRAAGPAAAATASRNFVASGRGRPSDAGLHNMLHGNAVRRPHLA